MVYERNFNLIERKFRELLFPTIANTITGNFAVLVDAFLISLILGSNYLSVVQCVEPLILLFVVINWTLGIGGDILSSVARTSFDDKKSNEIFTIALISGIIMSVAMMALSLLFYDSILQFLCSSATLRPLVGQYLIYLLISMPFVTYMVILAFFIRSFGFIKLQFWAYLICNIANIACDIIFMKYFNLGIAGAGLASLTGEIIGALIISYYFLSSKKSLKIVKIKLFSMISDFVDICKSGISISSTQFYMSLKFMFINYLLLAIAGELGLATLNMCNNTLYIALILILGVTHSLLPIASVYYKEEDYKGVNYSIHRAAKIVMVIGILFSLLVIIFPEIILFLFNVQNPADIPTVITSIRIFSLSFVGYGICNLYIFYIQAIQFNKLANVVSLFEGLIFPVIFAYLLGYLWGINGVWISFAVSEYLTILLLFIYSKYLEKKSKHEYSGFFINKQDNSIQKWEFTLKGTVEEVSKFSKEVQKHLDNSKSGTKTCQAIEGMLTQIINLNEEVDLIDIIIKNKKDKILISIKYSGIPCNPTEAENLKNGENKNLDFRMDDLSELTDNIEYSQILELNNVLIEINK